MVVDDWVVHDGGHWLRYQEKLPNGLWLCCFKPGPRGSLDNANAWVNILDRKWTDDLKPGAFVNIYENHFPHDELMLACVMHQLRKENGGGDAGVEK